MDYIISEKILNAVGNYLSRHPYSEVFQLIDALKGLKKNELPKPECKPDACAVEKKAQQVGDAIPGEDSETPKE